MYGVWERLVRERVLTIHPHSPFDWIDDDERGPSNDRQPYHPPLLWLLDL